MDERKFTSLTKYYNYDNIHLYFGAVVGFGDIDHLCLDPWRDMYD